MSLRTDPSLRRGVSSDPQEGALGADSCACSHSSGTPRAGAAGRAAGAGMGAKRCRRLAGPEEATAGRPGRLRRQRTASAAREAGPPPHTSRGGSPLPGWACDRERARCTCTQNTTGSDTGGLPAGPAGRGGRRWGRYLKTAVKQQQPGVPAAGRRRLPHGVGARAGAGAGGRGRASGSSRGQRALLNFHFLGRWTFSQFQKEKICFSEVCERQRLGESVRAPSSSPDSGVLGDQ